MDINKLYDYLKKEEKFCKDMIDSYDNDPHYSDNEKKMFRCFYDGRLSLIRALAHEADYWEGIL